MTVMSTSYRGSPKNQNQTTPDSYFLIHVCKTVAFLCNPCVGQRGTYTFLRGFCIVCCMLLSVLFFHVSDLGFHPHLEHRPSQKSEFLLFRFGFFDVCPLDAFFGVRFQRFNGTPKIPQDDLDKWGGGVHINHRTWDCSI